jgi:hypothetical protein
MTSTRLSDLMIIVIFLVIGGTILRAWLNAKVMPDDPSGEPTYQAPVHVRMRESPIATFEDLKNLMQPLSLTIVDGVIKVRTTELPRRLAATFGIDYTLAAGESSMCLARIGSHGTKLRERESVVLFATNRGKHVELAITPIDGDVERLQNALMEAGVQSNDDATLAPI